MRFRLRWRNALEIARQIDLKRRAVASLARDGDVAAALLDDAIDRGQAQSGPLLPFGAKKRLEDVCQSFSVHAAAGVADRKQHVLAWAGMRVGSRVFCVEHDVGGLDRQVSA